MKYLILLFSALFSLLISTVYAQDRPKIAVYCSGGNEQTKLEVWNSLHAAIGTNRKEVLKDVRNIFEQAMDNTSRRNLSDDMVMCMAERSGCQFIIITKIGSMSGRNYITSDFMELLSGKQIKSTGSYFFYTSNELVAACNKTIDELLGTDKSYATEIEGQQNLNTNDGLLIADGGKIYLDAKKLTEDEVKNKMSINSATLGLYNKGIRQYKQGNALLAVGISLVAVGIIVPIVLEIVDPGHAYLMMILPVSSTGLIIGLPGFSLRKKGKTNVRTAVNMYNYCEQGYTSQVEFGFSAAPNGIMMTINF